MKQRQEKIKFQHTQIDSHYKNPTIYSAVKYINSCVDSK